MVLLLNQISNPTDAHRQFSAISYRLTKVERPIVIGRLFDIQKNYRIYSILYRDFGCPE